MCLGRTDFGGWFFARQGAKDMNERRDLRGWLESGCFDASDLLDLRDRGGSARATMGGGANVRVVVGESMGVASTLWLRDGLGPRIADVRWRCSTAVKRALSSVSRM